jgi:hypothetical protein
MKRSLKKLHLRKETLSVLERRELLQVGGGITVYCTNSTCYPTQTCTVGCDDTTGTSKTPSCNGMCTNEN